MSDKELIARLRSNIFGTGTTMQAADRIEQLVATNEELETKLAECEARLGKAVETLEYYAVEALPWEADDSLLARATLAEIKGGNDAESNL